MNFTCIISEFNPITQGHQKIISQAREKTCNPIMCIMSGNFVQRGEPAIFDKYTRADLAIKAGADIVIELPTIYALSSATDFAYGAIKTISTIKNVEYLVFGSECGDLQALNYAMLKIKQNSNSKTIKQLLKQGNSYSIALNNALDLNLKSNDILGVEYLKALDKLKSKITPITIKREDNFNNSKTNEKLASASAIRQLLQNNVFEKAKLHSPLLTNINLDSQTNFSEYVNLLDFKLKTENNSLSKINGVKDGIQNFIIDNFDKNSPSLKTKRYPETKINRILANFILDINSALVKKAKHKDSEYIKVLAINKEKKELLKYLPKNKTIISKKDECKLNKIQKQVYQKDLLASKVFSCINKYYTGTEDYTHKL